MKKLFLLIVLLIGILASAQQSDTEIILAGVKQRDEQRASDKKAKEAKESSIKHANSDYTYLSSISKIATDKEALKIAYDIAALQDKKVRFLKTTEDIENSYYSVRFVPEEMTQAQYEALSSDDKNKLLTVRFFYWNEGENKDLELKGIKTYRLSQITGSYLQLFAFWKTYCKKDADLVESQKVSSSNSLKDIDANLYFIFYNDHHTWKILNR